jgi:hypothetical protein
MLVAVHKKGKTSLLEKRFGSDFGVGGIEPMRTFTTMVNG